MAAESDHRSVTEEAGFVLPSFLHFPHFGPAINQKVERIPIPIPAVIPVVGPIAWMLVWTRRGPQWQDESDRRAWRRATMFMGFVMLVLLALEG